MTAWLTQIRLNPRSRHVHRDLADVVGLHRRVMSLVPDDLGDNARRVAGVLFRLETDDPSPRLLVQTRTPPDPSRLPDGYGLAQTRDLSPLLDKLHPGQAIHYRIAANTSKRLGRCPAEGSPGQVVALRDDAAVRWWTDRQQRCGMALRTVHARSRADVTGSGRGSYRVRHAVTQFDGVALVEDADALRAAVLDGFGRGKPYGCGLLSIAPMRGRP